MKTPMENKGTQYRTTFLNAFMPYSASRCAPGLFLPLVRSFQSKSSRWVHQNARPTGILGALRLIVSKICVGVTNVIDECRRVPAVSSDPKAQILEIVGAPQPEIHRIVVRAITVIGITCIRPDEAIDA